jgi:hypothetical protein
MRAIILVLLLVPVGSGGMAVAESLSVQIVATDPPDRSELPIGAPLSVRIAYSSEEPIRFRIVGLLGGTPPTASPRSNPAPLYPAGRGEAIAWIEYTGPALIDEIRVEVSDRYWKLVASSTLTLEIDWRTGARPHAPAPWVGSLNDEQQEMTRAALAAANEGGDGWIVLFMAAAWSIPAYFILQLLLWWRWHGGWRRLALVPLLGTVPITAYTVFALLQGSNLWPLVMLFTLPWAFLYLLALVVLKRARDRGRRAA